MKWQTKAFVLRQLSSFYGGKQLYLALQGLLRTTRVQPRVSLRQAIELIKLVTEAEKSVANRTCVEIGTGWYAFTPLALYLAGAKKVITVDVNPWLTLSRVQKTVVSAESELSWFAETVDLPEDEVRRRYEAIDPSCRSVQKLLAQFNTEYRYPADARNLDLAPDSIDVVLSSNVLEHIPYDMLMEISVESCRILKPSGLFAHRFGPADHFINADSSITSANFLQFTSNEWKKYNEGLAYHNRLRCSQYKSLFTEAGFETLVERIHVDEKAVNAIQNRELIVAKEFAHLDVEDLAADYMRYLGQKPGATEDG